ncbi:MAG: lipopolysaccharide biosynthesis protein [Bacteroidota bacterium]
MSIKTQSLQGAIWTLAEKFGSRVLTLSIFFILARLLDSQAFGIVAIVTSIVHFMEIFVEQGLTASLIQKEDIDELDKQSAFWGSLLIGSVLYILVFLGAPLVSLIYDEPSFTYLLRLLGVVFPITAIATVPISMLQRELNFKPLAIRQLLAALVAGSVGITLALRGMGAESVIWYHLILGIVMHGTLFFLTPWRPKLMFSWERYKSLLSFGISITGNKLIFFGNGQLLGIVIGYFLGIPAAGYFGIAQKVMTTVRDIIQSTMSRIAFPLFSKFQSKPKELESVFKNISEKVSAISFPIFFFIIACSSEIVIIFFGEQWTLSIPLLQWQVASLIPGMIVTLNNDIMLGMGKSGLCFRFQVYGTLFSILLLLGAPYYGLIWVAAISAMQMIFMLPLGINMTRPFFKIMRKDILLPVVKSLAVGAVLGAALVLFDQLVSFEKEIYQLIAKSVLSLILLPALYYVFHQGLIMEGKNQVRSFLHKIKPTS